MGIITMIQAVKLAIELIDGEIKRTAVDANLYNAGARYPYAINAHERREKLDLARALFVATLAEIQTRAGGSRVRNEPLQ